MILSTKEANIDVAHIDVKFRFVHELFKDKVISLKYYPMTE